MADRKHENETFGPEPIFIDGKIFLRCTFNGTKLIVTGDGDVGFHECKLNQVTFELSGSAGRTLNFLRSFYNSGDPGGRALVEHLLTGAPKTQQPTSKSGSWQA
jgi:hypothetical protein